MGHTPIKCQLVSHSPMLQRGHSKLLGLKFNNLLLVFNIILIVKIRMRKKFQFISFSTDFSLVWVADLIFSESCAV